MSNMNSGPKINKDLLTAIVVFSIFKLDTQNKKAIKDTNPMEPLLGMTYDTAVEKIEDWFKQGGRCEDIFKILDDQDAGKDIRDIFPKKLAILVKNKLYTNLTQQRQINIFQDEQGNRTKIKQEITNLSSNITIEYPPSRLYQKANEYIKIAQEGKDKFFESFANELKDDVFKDDVFKDDGICDLEDESVKKFLDDFADYRTRMSARKKNPWSENHLKKINEKLETFLTQMQNNYIDLMLLRIYYKCNQGSFADENIDTLCQIVSKRPEAFENYFLAKIKKIESFSTSSLITKKYNLQAYTTSVMDKVLDKLLRYAQSTPTLEEAHKKLFEYLFNNVEKYNDYLKLIVSEYSKVFEDGKPPPLFQYIAENACTVFKTLDTKKQNILYEQIKDILISNRDILPVSASALLPDVHHVDMVIDILSTKRLIAPGKVVYPIENPLCIAAKAMLENKKPWEDYKGILLKALSLRDQEPWSTYWKYADDNVLRAAVLFFDSTNEEQSPIFDHLLKNQEIISNISCNTLDFLWREIKKQKEWFPQLNFSLVGKALSIDPLTAKMNEYDSWYSAMINCQEINRIDKRSVNYLFYSRARMQYAAAQQKKDENDRDGYDPNQNAHREKVEEMVRNKLPMNFLTGYVVKHYGVSSEDRAMYLGCIDVRIFLIKHWISKNDLVSAELIKIFGEGFQQKKIANMTFNEFKKFCEFNSNSNGTNRGGKILQAIVDPKNKGIVLDDEQKIKLKLFQDLFSLNETKDELSQFFKKDYNGQNLDVFEMAKSAWRAFDPLRGLHGNFGRDRYSKALTIFSMIQATEDIELSKATDKELTKCLVNGTPFEQGKLKTFIQAGNSDGAREFVKKYLFDMQNKMAEIFSTRLSEAVFARGGFGTCITGLITRFRDVLALSHKYSLSDARNRYDIVRDIIQDMLLTNLDRELAKIISAKASPVLKKVTLAQRLGLAKDPQVHIRKFCSSKSLNDMVKQLKSIPNIEREQIYKSIFPGQNKPEDFNDMTDIKEIKDTVDALLSVAEDNRHLTKIIPYSKRILSVHTSSNSDTQGEEISKFDTTYHRSDYLNKIFPLSTIAKNVFKAFKLLDKNFKNNKQDNENILYLVNGLGTIEDFDRIGTIIFKNLDVIAAALKGPVAKTPEPDQMLFDQSLLNNIYYCPEPKKMDQTKVKHALAQTRIESLLYTLYNNRKPIDKENTSTLLKKFLQRLIKFMAVHTPQYGAKTEIRVAILDFLSLDNMPEIEASVLPGYAAYEKYLRDSVKANPNSDILDLLFNQEQIKKCITATQTTNPHIILSGALTSRSQPIQNDTPLELNTNQNTESASAVNKPTSQKSTTDIPTVQPQLPGTPKLNAAPSGGNKQTTTSNPVVQNNPTTQTVGSVAERMKAFQKPNTAVGPKLNTTPAFTAATRTPVANNATPQKKPTTPVITGTSTQDGGNNPQKATTNPVTTKEITNPPGSDLVAQRLKKLQGVNPATNPNSSQPPKGTKPVVVGTNVQDRIKALQNNKGPAALS